MVETFLKQSCFRVAMGRIKTQLTKRLSFTIVKTGEPGLAKTFDENKVVVAELLGGASKKLRNTVAGYVTRLMKHKEDY